jgi:hypothetical protein
MADRIGVMRPGSRHKNLECGIVFANARHRGARFVHTPDIHLFSIDLGFAPPKGARGRKTASQRSAAITTSRFTETASVQNAGK